MIQDILSKKLGDLSVQEFLRFERYREKLKDDRIVISIDEAATLANSSRSTIKRRIADGSLKAKRIDGRTLVLLKGFRDWLEKT